MKLKNEDTDFMEGFRDTNYWGDSFPRRMFIAVLVFIIIGIMAIVL